MQYLAPAKTQELYWLIRAIYVSCLVYLPLLVKQHNPQELSLFKVKFKETLVFIRMPLGHFISGPDFERRNFILMLKNKMNLHLNVTTSFNILPHTKCSTDLEEKYRQSLPELNLRKLSKVSTAVFYF